MYEIVVFSDGVYDVVSLRPLNLELPLRYGNAGKMSLVLAPERTRRKDPLDHFNIYNGGWNISNPHYIAVSFLLSHSPLEFPCSCSFCVFLYGNVDFI